MMNELRSFPLSISSHAESTKNYIRVREDVDATELHSSVAPDRWCLAQEDLTAFRKEIHEAVAKGKVKPTELDPFDPEDDMYGPCIHTIVQQFIKPVTSQAGAVSWALMLHPEGLPCDLFVTHAWSEGIYEFIDKVVNSWPPHAKHAYCCMFSNPQNLDISAMIASPEQSPFASALKSARYVLVIPNRKASIYTRMWCVYEAFLGIKLGKTILTATPPLIDFWHNLRVLLAFSLLGTCIGIGAGVALVTRSGEQGYTYAVKIYYSALWLLLEVIILAAVFRSGGVKAKFLNRVHAAWASTFAIFGPMFCGYGLEEMSRQVVATAAEIKAYFICAQCCILIFSMLLEADRQWLDAAELQALQLRNAFNGSVVDAECSNPEDKVHIMEEISEKGGYAVVDASIDVLLKASMSTPELRELSIRGTNIEDVGIYRVSLVFLGMAIWIVSFVFGAQKLVPGTYIVSGFLEVVAFLMIWITMPLDRRHFAARALGYLIGLSYTAFNMVGVPAMALGFATRQISKNLVLLNAFILGPLLIIIAALGPLRASQVPVIGACLVRFLMHSTNMFERQRTNKRSAASGLLDSSAL